MDLLLQFRKPDAKFSHGRAVKDHIQVEVSTVVRAVQVWCTFTDGPEALVGRALDHSLEAIAGSGPGSRRPDSFMSPKSSISTPVEDMPGTSRIPNLADLGSKVAGLQKFAPRGGQSSTNMGPSATQQRKHAAGAQQNMQDAVTVSKCRDDGNSVVAKSYNQASSSEGEAGREEEAVVAAAGAAAMMSCHALSALDLLSGGSARQWQKLKVKAEQDQLKECTFIPKTNRRRAPHEWEPLPTRLGRLQKMRSERLMQIRLAAENGDPDLTFKPSLNDRSLRMAEELRDAQELRDAAAEVHSAPSRPASAGGWPPANRLPTSPHPLRPTPGLAENEANCTFAPAINPASERLLEDSTNLPADFQARQRFFAQQRKAHLQRIASQSGKAQARRNMLRETLMTEAMKECTFRPRTNESANKALISQILAAADLASPQPQSSSDPRQTAVAC
ncbi:hypothetical protein WJX74_003307 [Apatococcus lobatus]|uniref:Uncharacterized protein n=1 Tax=Apatococcus lobatus TaxID=904363 RepID=A0AAW1QW56_9CHLO